MAALSIQAELYVHTSLWPSQLLKLQLNGVTATMAPPTTTWLHTESPGRMSVWCKLAAAPRSISLGTLSVNVSHKWEGESSAIQL